MRATRLVLVGVLAASCADAATAQLAVYDAGRAGLPAVAPDPVTQGWTRTDPSGGQVTTIDVSPDGTTGLNGWKIDDAVTFNGGRLHYARLFSSADRARAASEGWELEARMRMISSSGVSIFMEYATGTSSASDRYLLFFTVSGSDVVADVFLSGTSYTCTGGADGAYHSFVVRKPPGAGVVDAELLYDGVVLGPLPRAGSNGNAPNGGVNWGSGSSGGMGHANWNLVAFRIGAVGSVFCAGDGAVTSCPCGNDAPVAGEGCLHSGGRGMTIAGAGTSSVSADDLTLLARHCPPGNTGIFAAGKAAPTPVNALFDGLLCVGGELRFFRGRFQTDGIASDGGFVAQDTSGLYFAPAGTVYFQYASRDVAAGTSPCGGGANLSAAYAVTMTP